MRELSLHILDIAENSVRAEATRVEILVDVDSAEDTLAIKIVDNGRGMDPELAKAAVDPFTTSRTERHVGLGLPLLKAACQQTGGSFTLDSVPGQGTTVTAILGLTNIDRAPMGSLTDTVVNLTAAHPEIDFVMRVSQDTKTFVFDSGEVKVILDGAPLDNPKIVEWLREFIEAGIAEVTSLE